MNLITFSEKIDERVALVYWKTNADISGLLTVSLEFNTPNIAIAAELVAIKELLFNKQITVGSPLPPFSYELIGVFMF